MLLESKGWGDQQRKRVFWGKSLTWTPSALWLYDGLLPAHHLRPGAPRLLPSGRLAPKRAPPWSPQLPLGVLLLESSSNHCWKQAWNPRGGLPRSRVSSRPTGNTDGGGGPWVSKPLAWPGFQGCWEPAWARTYAGGILWLKTCTAVLAPAYHMVNGARLFCTFQKHFSSYPCW